MNNRAGYSGGAVRNHGEILFTDGNILWNTAGYSGGGIDSQMTEDSEPPDCARLSRHDQGQ